MKLTACCVILLALARGAYGVEIDSSGDYQNTTSSTPGAAYVGQINDGASGTYLGDGYVLTAAHVGVGDFMLDGVTYTPVANSAVSFTTGPATVNGTLYPTSTADLTLFQITGNPLPTLAPLILALDPPTAYVPGASNGTTVTMIGYGGGNGETYGTNQITRTDQVVNLYDGQTPPTYISYDFVTDDGTFTGSSTFTNNAQLIGGDSGGGDFAVLPNGSLELIGINEVYYTDVTDGPPVASGMIQLSDGYSEQIDAVTGIPEPSTWLLAAAGIGSLFAFRRRSPRVSAD